MKFKAIITSIILGSVLVGVVIIASFISFGDKESVESSDEAISIAQEYVCEKYENDFSDYVISADLTDGTWTVWYSVKNTDGKIDILGGGGPEVKINQSDGKVISCLLQK